MSKNKSQNTKQQVNNFNIIPQSWMNNPGVIDYPLTNDYMFRAVLQRSKTTLRHLCSSALHIPVEDIADIVIDNAIELGEAITSKTFIMDINVTLNNHDRVNLEMQVVNEHNWPNRSLVYLCRRFDHLQSGEDYNSTAPVTHISFLDFDLFPSHLEFYASNKLMNVKNHLVYNDNFTLNVLSLNRTELATEEDKYWQLDLWAKIFKSTTWKELKDMVNAIENQGLQEAIVEAVDTLYLNNSDETIRQQCEARREQLFHEKYMAEKMKKLERIEKEIDEKEEVIAAKEEVIAKKDEELAKKADELDAEKLKGIQTLIETIKEFGGSREAAMQKLIEKYPAYKDEAEQLVEKYWA